MLEPALVFPCILLHAISSSSQILPEMEVIEGLLGGSQLNAKFANQYSKWVQFDITGILITMIMTKELWLT